MEKFECSMCGKCCTHMDKVIENLHLLADVIGEDNAHFPYSHNNGICEKLMLETNLCSVFEDRPIICDIQKFTEVISQKTNTDLSIIRKSLYFEGKKICKLLQEE